MNNRGFTIPELMIYLVLGLLITGYTLNAIGHFADNYVHSREVTKMQQTGRDAINVIARDISNMGLKYYIAKSETPITGGDSAVYTFSPASPTTNGIFLASYTGAKVHSGTVPEDSAASFYNGNSTPNDTIAFFRGSLTSAGVIDRTYHIRWKVVNEVLMRYVRRCTTAALNSGNIVWSTWDSSAVLENVKGFQIQFSATGKDGEWKDSPAGTTPPSRHLMKYVRISLLVSSDRTSDKAGSASETVGNITVAKDGTHLYRTYEQIVRIPNNGILNP